MNVRKIPTSIPGSAMKTSRIGVRSFVMLAMTATFPHGASYFFAPDGDDSRTPVEAQGELTPWKSFSKLNALALKPGDKIRLKRGGVFRQTLIVTASGSEGSPITIGSYGREQDPDPEIRGTELVTGTLVDGVRSAKIDVGGNVSSIFDESDPLAVARFPVDTGWIYATKGENDSTVAATSLVGGDWSGASIHMRTNPWTLETHTVKNGRGGRLLLDKMPTADLHDSYYFLSNHANAFAKPGTWYYSVNDSILRWRDYLNKSLDEIEVSVRDAGIIISKTSFVAVQGIKVFGTRVVGIHGDGGKNLVVENCTVRFPGQTGIRLTGVHNQIKSNDVVGAASNSVINHGLKNWVANNKIRRTAMLTLLGPDGMGPGCCTGHGIAVSGDSAYVANNSIDSVGYCGITFVGQYSLIEKNTIGNHCMTTEDGGGIYTTAGGADIPGSSGSVIRFNRILATKGSASGKVGTNPEFNGIALDNNSHDIRIDSNVISGTARGIGGHNSRRISAKGNILFGNAVSQIDFFFGAEVSESDIRSNVFQNNTLLSRPGQKLLATSSAEDYATIYSTFSGNVFCTDFLTSVRCTKNGVTWERERIAANDPLIGPETQGMTVVGDQVGNLTSPGILKIDNNSVLATGIPSAPSASGKFRVRVTAGEQWLVSFRARGIKQNQPLGVTLERTTGDFARLAKIPVSYLDTVWLRYDYLIAVTSSDTSAKLQFSTASNYGSYWLKDFSFRKVPITVTDTLPTSHIVDQLPHPLPKSLIGTWLDLEGHAIQNFSASTNNPDVAIQIDHIPPPEHALQPKDSSKSAMSAILIYLGNQTWRVEGLAGSATAFDFTGRVLGRLIPNPEGIAVWSYHASRGPCWLRINSTIIPLLTIR